ncbi:hypothetical protein BC628DRAFT_385738 [Trametes gibbosa]|nr:hypothetical protein BC628DRAFT_385738 [Trametes gibbosa]
MKNITEPIADPLPALDLDAYIPTSRTAPSHSAALPARRHRLGQNRFRGHPFCSQTLRCVAARLVVAHPPAAHQRAHSSRGSSPTDMGETIPFSSSMTRWCQWKGSSLKWRQVGATIRVDRAEGSGGGKGGEDEWDYQGDRGRMVRQVGVRVNPSEDIRARALVCSQKGRGRLMQVTIYHSLLVTANTEHRRRQKQTRKEYTVTRGDISCMRRRSDWCTMR